MREAEPGELGVGWEKGDEDRAEKLVREPKMNQAPQRLADAETTKAVAGAFPSSDLVQVGDPG